MRIYLNYNICEALDLDYNPKKEREFYLDCIDILYHARRGNFDRKHMEFFGGLIKSGITRIKYRNEGLGWFKAIGAILK
jgi:hypothetical protein